jgi:hypothetical protein
LRREMMAVLADAVPRIDLAYKLLVAVQKVFDPSLRK